MRGLFRPYRYGSPASIASGFYSLGWRAMKRREVRLHVTDHAVLRYLERVHGLDVEALRDHIGDLAKIGAEYQASSVVVGKVRIIIDERHECDPCGLPIVAVPTVLAGWMKRSDAEERKRRSRAERARQRLEQEPRNG